MRPRRLRVAPRAKRDVDEIVLWYRDNLGAAAAAKVLRTLRAGFRATMSISAAAATRPDLPEGFYRVVAKAHVVIFRIEADVSLVVRVVHGARDMPAALE